MKLFLDDVRTPPDDSWTWAKTADEAIKLLETGKVTVASLDHDLADEHYGGVSEANDILAGERTHSKTGYDVVLWLRQRVESDPSFRMPIMRLHTMNPVGRANMGAVLEDIWEIVREREINNEANGGE